LEKAVATFKKMTAGMVSSDDFYGTIQTHVSDRPISDCGIGAML
jgi:hypothetical protein